MMVTVSNSESTLTQSVSTKSVAATVPGIPNRITRYWHRFTVCYVICLERRQMRALTDEALQDMGLDRADAKREADRGFFDVPRHRLE